MKPCHLALPTLSFPARSLGAVLAGLVLVAAPSAEALDLYIATGGKGQPDAPSGIYHARLDPDTGKLTLPQLAAEVAHPAFLAMTPNGRFLFSATAEDGDSRLVSFAIGEGGSLSRINTQPSEGAVIMSPEAKSSFIQPDLAPLPQPLSS
jgi:hypothetical protein